MELGLIHLEIAGEELMATGTLQWLCQLRVGFKPIALAIANVPKRVGGPRILNNPFPALS